MKRTRTLVFIVGVFLLPLLAFALLLRLEAGASFAVPFLN